MKRLAALAVLLLILPGCGVMADIIDIAGTAADIAAPPTRGDLEDKRAALVAERRKTRPGTAEDRWLGEQIQAIDDKLR